jgi:hypothetical protein
MVNFSVKYREDIGDGCSFGRHVARHNRIFLIVTKFMCPPSQKSNHPSLVFVIYCIHESYTVPLTVLIKALCAELEGLGCKFWVVIA